MNFFYSINSNQYSVMYYTGSSRQVEGGFREQKCVRCVLKKFISFASPASGN